MIAGGRQPVRDALYIAALPAIRFDPNIKAFYTKLRANGKQCLTRNTVAFLFGYAPRR